MSFSSAKAERGYLNFLTARQRSGRHWAEWVCASSSNPARQDRSKTDPWTMMQKLQTVLSKASPVLDCRVAASATSPGERQHHNPPSQATMSADPLQALASAGQGKNTRSLLRVIILGLIAAAAIASRLFSVIRTCPFWCFVDEPCNWALELGKLAFVVATT